MRRIMRELSELKKSPPEGIRVQTSDEDMLDVTGIIEGPEGTPYAGGYFRVKFKFTEEFPAAPPKCWFATKIFHPNVSSSGEICVNTLKRDWKSTYGINQILVTVKCLLIYPNPESALDEEAGKLLLENYDSYCARAKLITSVHATPRRRPVEFDTPSAVEQENKEEGSSKALSQIASSKPPSSASSQPTSSIPTSPVPLGVPVAAQKSVSSSPTGLKAVLSADKDSAIKERHPSPSPLGTADSNVGKAASGVGMGMPPTTNGSTVTTTKAVKRSATGSAQTSVEKRKKALKRL